MKNENKEMVEIMEEHEKISNILLYGGLFVILIIIVRFGLVLISQDIIINQMADLPKRVCHNETTTEKIELETGFIINCRSIAEGEEITCEDGVTIYDGSKEVCNWRDNETKVCIIKTTKEVCEIK